MRQNKTVFWKWAAMGLCLCAAFGVEAQAEEEPESLISTVMGTDVSIRVYGAKGTAEPLLDMLSEIEDEWLSWRVEDSDIARLNASAGKEEGNTPGEKTWDYLALALELSEKSGGAFDVTIGEISKLWGLGTAQARVPKQEEIHALLPNVGYEKITMKDGSVWMEEGTSVDLGAIGKGIGCQEAEEMLLQTEADGAVVAIGGSILLYGRKPDGSDWKIGIANPRAETGDSYLGTLTLGEGTAISTSGDYEKYLIQDGVRYHHILDPKTGYPAQSGLISVTVVCKEGWLSDGLSTACFVLGYEKSLELLEQYEAEAVFVDEGYHVCVTEGLEDAFDLTGTAYEMAEEL